MAKSIRIGGASAFWGDTSIAAPQLVHGGETDYLVFDYLAEVTMSILARQRAKSAELGYATDFVSVTMKSLLRDITSHGIKVISNAGGTNPLACRDALLRVAEDAGIEVKVGVVLGDDLLPREAEFRDAGVTEMFAGTAFPSGVMSINAYLGARPIAAALAQDCDIVITGRCVDSAVTLAACMHEFGWADDDFDRLAAGTLAGHIIECGAQCTGGLFTDWQRVESWENIGYPVAEMSADGSFTISKPPDTDGLICFGSVAEQLLYEIGDPGAYMVPDVVCDFTGVEMREIGDNLVRVSGARGLPPTATYKVSATYRDGYRSQALMVIGGIDAAAKARRTGETIVARTRKMFAECNLGDYSETRIEVVGAEEMYGAQATPTPPREVVLKMAVKHDEKAALEIFAREYAAPGTSMAPGTTGFSGGRPAPVPVVRLFSFLLDKTDVPIQLDIDGNVETVSVRTAGGFKASASETVDAVPAKAPDGETVAVPLVRLAYGRSGDKGNNANIGVIARRPEYLPLLRWALTETRVADHFAHNLEGRVERFDLPGLHAMNFLLHDTLGGGGTASLHTDNLAKAYAQVLLDISIDVPRDLAATLDAA